MKIILALLLAMSFSCEDLKPVEPIEEEENNSLQITLVTVMVKAYECQKLGLELSEIKDENGNKILICVEKE